MWAREHFVLDGGSKHLPTRKVCRSIVEYRDYGKTRRAAVMWPFAKLLLTAKRLLINTVATFGMKTDVV